LWLVPNSPNGTKLVAPIRFEDTPALRSAMVLVAGAAGKPAQEHGKWLYWWLLELGSWPEGSFVRNCLRAAGSELRFIAGLLETCPRCVSHCQKAYDPIAWIALSLGEEVPKPTPGAFREPLLMHITHPTARAAFEDIGLRLWEWAVRQAGFSAVVRPAVVADLRLLADYLSDLARLVEEAPLQREDGHLAALPREIAGDVANLAQLLELQR
jgi:hypothetical protein